MYEYNRFRKLKLYISSKLKDQGILQSKKETHEHQRQSQVGL